MLDLTIVIPTFNPDQHQVEQAVFSALAIVSSDKVIVVDDCSPKFPNTLREFLFTHKISFYENQANLGMAANWNRAVRCASSKFVLNLGQDDILCPEAVLANLKTLQKHPSATSICCQRRFINENGEAIHVKRWGNDRAKIPFRRSINFFRAPQVRGLALSLGNIFGEPSAVIFRGSVFAAVDGYDESMKHAADLDFIVRISDLGEVIVSTSTGCLRRLHSGNLTRSNRKLGIISRERTLLFKRNISLVSSEFRKTSELYLRLNACKDIASLSFLSWLKAFAALSLLVFRYPKTSLNYILAIGFGRTAAFRKIFRDCF